MYSFYLPERITDNTTSISDAEQLHHLRDVLRLKAGDEIVVFDGEGDEYLCEIMELDKKHAGLQIKTRKSAPIRKLKLAIACAIPKQSRMDDIVDKLTQLGVDSIIPLVTQRVIVKLGGTQENRLERWRKIALSASEQSHRNTLPNIFPVIGLQEFLVESKGYELKLMPTLTGERKTIRQVLAGSTPASILVLIGPEGDFTPEEIQDAFSAGVIPISLGDTVLRVDTAAIAVASYIKLHSVE
jgi:16S rRNA (uracil1498-N3)-methyltransferase